MRPRIKTDRLLIAITCLHVALLSAWATAVPLYDAPDEPMHLDMVVDAWEQIRWPGPREKIYHAGWYDGLVELRFSSSDRAPTDRALDPVSAAQAPAERRTWNELAATGLPSDTVRNQMAQHPPLFYRFARALLGLVPGWGDLPLATTVSLLRLLSVAIALPLPALAWGAAGALGGHRAQRAAAGLLVVAIPTLTHINSTITNDVLLTTCAGACLLLIAKMVAGDRRPGALVGVWASASAAMLVKAFGLVLGPAALLATAIAVRRDGCRGRGRALAVSALAAVPAVWWYVENVVRYGTPQPQGFPVVADPDAVVDGVTFTRTVGRTIPSTFWGSFGWLEVTAPLLLVVALSLLGGGLVLAGLIRLWRGGQRLIALALVSPTVLTLLLMLVASWQRYSVSGEIRGLHGRYLFVGVVGLVAVAAHALPARQRWGRRLWPLAALALAGAVQGQALHAVLTHFWVGAGPWDKLLAVRAWSTLPDLWLGIVLTAAPVAAVWVCVDLLRPSGEAEPLREPPPPEPG